MDTLSQSDFNLSGSTARHQSNQSYFLKGQIAQWDYPPI
jgi:hypothetical protein